MSERPELSDSELLRLPAAQRMRILRLRLLAAHFADYEQNHTTRGNKITHYVGIPLIGLSLLGVPYSLVFAALAAPLEFIPVLGPLTAAVSALLVASFSGYEHLLWIALFFVAYRIFQDYVLSPYLMSEGIEIHPVLVIVGILAGEEIAGVPGMFLALPFLAALKVVLERVRRGRAGARPAAVSQ